MRIFLAVLLGCCVVGVGSIGLAAEKPLINVVYDVADIATAFRIIDNKDQSQPYSEQEFLQRLRRTSTHTNFKESLSPLDTLEIRIHEKTMSLVVRASQTQHDRLAAFLQKIRTEELVQVTYEVRCITLSADGLKKAELAYDKVIKEDDSIPVGITELTDIEAFHFVQNAQADLRSNIIFAPKMTGVSGQTVGIKEAKGRPLVTGVEVTADNQRQTELTVIDEGIAIELVGFVLDDQSVKLHAKATISKLQNVDVVDFSLKTSDDKVTPASLQIPEADKLVTKIDTKLAPETSILMVFLKPETVPARPQQGIVHAALNATGLSPLVEKAPDEKVYTAIMITPRIVKE